MVDEFELFKARSYTGGTDAAAILVRSPPRHANGNADDDESRDTTMTVTSSFRPRRLDWPGE
jgi:hypothetical protein